MITSAEVTAISRKNGAWLVQSTVGDYECARIVTCAGLQSDRIAALTGANRTVRIVPFRGEYYKIRPERESLVRHLIYPVPDPKFPFLGVHFTRMIHGGVEAGPNAVLALAREGYTKTDINPRDIFDALTFNGLWRFLGKYPKMCWQETRRSFSRELFCAVASAAGPRNPHRRSGRRRRRRSSASHVARWIAGGRFSFRPRPRRTARSERSEPRRNRVASAGRRNRRVAKVAKRPCVHSG